MKLIFLALHFFVFCLSLQAQTKSYRAVYETGRTVTIAPGKSAINYGYKRLDIFTSNSFYHFPLGFDDVDSSISIYGEKIKQHSYYYFSDTKKAYYGQEKTFGKGHLVETNYKPSFASGWIIDHSFQQKYLNYNCKKAYRIWQSGDTLFAVYTPEINYPPGITYLNELPGMLIYSFNSANNLHTKIVSFEEGNFEIVLPQKVRIKKNNSK